MQAIRLFSELILPIILLIFLIAAVKNKINAYDAFLEGAKDSIFVVGDIFPAVAGLMVAIGMLRGSGLLDFIITLMAPATDFIGMPREILPLALLRPLSGSGGIAILSDILENYHPDSFIGITASVMAASTETTFYTVAVYFGAVGLKNVRHTLKAALIADFVNIMASVFVCRLLLFSV